jgi:hypothetical protein
MERFMMRRIWCAGLVAALMTVAAWGQTTRFSSPGLAEEKDGLYLGKTMDQIAAEGFTTSDEVTAILARMKEGDRNRRLLYIDLSTNCRVDQDKVFLALVDLNEDPDGDIRHFAQMHASNVLSRLVDRNVNTKSPEMAATYDRIIAAVEKRGGVPKGWAQKYVEFLTKTEIDQGRFVEYYIKVLPEAGPDTPAIPILAKFLASDRVDAQRKIIAAIRADKPLMHSVLVKCWSNRGGYVGEKITPQSVVSQLLIASSGDERMKYMGLFYSDDVSRESALMDGLAAAVNDNNPGVSKLAFEKLKTIEGASVKYALIIKRGEEIAVGNEIMRVQQNLADPMRRREMIHDMMAGRVAAPHDFVVQMISSSDVTTRREGWQIAYQNPAFFKSEGHEKLWSQAASSEDKSIRRGAWRFAERHKFVLESGEGAQTLEAAIYSPDAEIQTSARKLWQQSHTEGFPIPPGMGAVIFISLLPLIVGVGMGAFMVWRMIKAPLRKIAKLNPMKGGAMTLTITGGLMIGWQFLALLGLLLVAAHLEWWMAMPVLLMVFGIIFNCVVMLIMARRAKGGHKADFAGLATLVGLIVIFLGIDLIARFGNLKVTGSIGGVHIGIETLVIVALSIGVIWMAMVRGQVTPAEIGKPQRLTDRRSMNMPAPGGGQGNFDAISALSGFGGSEVNTPNATSAGSTPSARGIPSAPSPASARGVPSAPPPPRKKPAPPPPPPLR